MIFPILRGILTPTLTPATWFLISVNLIVFFSNHHNFLAAQKELDTLFRNEKFIDTQGAVFTQYILENPKQHSKLIRTFADRSARGDKYARSMLGGFAYRSRPFMQAAEDKKFDGDEIALAAWKKDFQKLRDVQEKHPNHKWGLSAERAGFKNWITYQFAHSGWQHLLFMNMIYLALFGTFLEVTLGSSLVILIYLGSGFAGAGLFALFGGLTNSPLIGASGAISGLMAAVAAYKWRQSVRFSYFLTPVHYGIQDLPAWLIVLVCFIPDIAGALASYSDISGVAYTAHIGGALFGALAGYAARKGWLEAEPLIESSPPPSLQP